MVWNLNYPPGIVYHAVEELAAVSVSGNIPNKQAQIFTIGVEMIWKNQYFGTGIIKYFEPPAVDHTWHIFKPASQLLVLH